VVRLSPSRFAGVSDGAKRQSGFRGIKGTNLKGLQDPTDPEPSLQSNLEVEHEDG
jgi:hypothetical protein